MLQILEEEMPKYNRLDIMREWRDELLIFGIDDALAMRRPSSQMPYFTKYFLALMLEGLMSFQQKVIAIQHVFSH
jgi:hypothetical protein